MPLTERNKITKCGNVINRFGGIISQVTSLVPDVAFILIPIVCRSIAIHTNEEEVAVLILDVCLICSAVCIPRHLNKLRNRKCIIPYKYCVLLVHIFNIPNIRNEVNGTICRSCIDGDGVGSCLRYFVFGVRNSYCLLANCCHIRLINNSPTGNGSVGAVRAGMSCRNNEATSCEGFTFRVNGLRISSIYCDCTQYARLNSTAL